MRGIVFDNFQKVCSGLGHFLHFSKNGLPFVDARVAVVPFCIWSKYFKTFLWQFCVFFKKMLWSPFFILGLCVAPPPPPPPPPPRLCVSPKFFFLGALLECLKHFLWSTLFVDPMVACGSPLILHLIKIFKNMFLSVQKWLFWWEKSFSTILRKFEVVWGTFLVF
jgi:hypothetical protein